MLIKIKKLLIENDGYKRNIHLKDMYVNETNIVSIIDYDGVNDFLIRENSLYSNDSFSLIKINEGNDIVDIIAYGSAESILISNKKTSQSGKQLLND